MKIFFAFGLLRRGVPKGVDGDKGSFWESRLALRPLLDETQISVGDFPAARPDGLRS